MAYDIQNYWTFGFYLSSEILKTRNQNVSETDCVSSPKDGGSNLFC
jgi:hypothetical protein